MAIFPVNSRTTISGGCLVLSSPSSSGATRRSELLSGAEFKRAAAQAALAYVQDGMRLGLGTGSTAAQFVAGLGARVAGGLEVVCVATSKATAEQAAALAIPLTTLDETPQLDLTVDGADELDARLRLVKGGGGALLREKIVAASSRRMIVIADHSKQVAVLGAFPLPVEVVTFASRATALKIERAAAGLGLDGPVSLRMAGGRPFITDNGNFIYDCAFSRIAEPDALAAALAAIPGVVEHGLFIGLAERAILAGPHGVREVTA